MGSNRTAAASPGRGAAPPTSLPPLAEVLGHDFADPGLLSRALTHGSVPRRRRGAGDDYQRLEFVGDRVLYAVRGDTSNGFELCPADVCEVDSQKAGEAFCPSDSKAPNKFTVLPDFVEQKAQEMLAAERQPAPAPHTARVA